MTLITEEYRALNAALHVLDRGYGASAATNWTAVVATLADAYGLHTVLDYGCGKGTLAVALAQKRPRLEVHEYDPAIPGKDAAPAPAELVVCTDVLEHVEPACLDAVLAHLLELATRMVFLDVSTERGRRLLPNGQHCHVNVQPAEWWRAKLATYGTAGKWYEPIGRLRPRPGHYVAGWKRT